MQYSKIALAVMLTAAATAVSATDIQIYGRVDAGLMFEDADGGERSLTMKSGGRTSSRLGFNIKEDLGNGNFVKVYLENGFKVDDGSFSTADTLFDRRAILAVQGAWGELGLGRAGTVQSILHGFHQVGRLRHLLLELLDRHDVCQLQSRRQRHQLRLACHEQPQVRPLLLHGRQG